MCQAWLARPMILAFRRLRQGDSRFEVNLGYRISLRPTLAT